MCLVNEAALGKNSSNLSLPWPSPRHEGLFTLAIIFSTEEISRCAFEAWRGGPDFGNCGCGREEEAPEERACVAWPGSCDVTATSSAPGLKPQQGACSAHGSLHGQPVGWGLRLGVFNLFPKPRLPRVGSPLAAMSFWPDRAFLPTGQDGRPRNSYPRSGIPWSPLDHVTSAPLWCWGTGAGQLLIPPSQIKTFPSHFP